jgi:hypothetical protein
MAAALGVLRSGLFYILLSALELEKNRAAHRKFE